VKRSAPLRLDVLDRFRGRAGDAALVAWDGTQEADGRARPGWEPVEWTRVSVGISGHAGHLTVLPESGTQQRLE
jgi:hypothetical protein